MSLKYVFLLCAVPLLLASFTDTASAARGCRNGRFETGVCHKLPNGKCRYTAFDGTKWTASCRSGGT
jgi:hypothetical protein